MSRAPPLQFVNYQFASTELIAQLIWELNNPNTEFSEYILLRTARNMRENILRRQVTAPFTVDTIMLLTRDANEILFAYQTEDTWNEALRIARGFRGISTAKVLQKLKEVQDTKRIHQLAKEGLRRETDAQEAVMEAQRQEAYARSARAENRGTVEEIERGRQNRVMANALEEINQCRAD